MCSVILFISSYQITMFWFGFNSIQTSLACFLHISRSIPWSTWFMCYKFEKLINHLNFFFSSESRLIDYSGMTGLVSIGKKLLKNWNHILFLQLAHENWKLLCLEILLVGNSHQSIQLFLLLSILRTRNLGCMQYNLLQNTAGRDWK